MSELNRINTAGSFQSITCTGTDNNTQNNQNTKKKHDDDTTQLNTDWPE